MPTRVRVARIHTNQIERTHKPGHEPQVYDPPLIQGITSPESLVGD